MTGEGAVVWSDREKQWESGLFLGTEPHELSGAWKVGRRKEVPGAITVVIVFINWRK